jgi:hypothetical protein
VSPAACIALMDLKEMQAEINDRTQTRKVAVQPKGNTDDTDEARMTTGRKSCF